MAMQMIQRDLHAQLRHDLLEARERVAAVVRPLDGAQLNEHPEPKGWSVGQVLEHLIISDELYEASLAAMLRSSRADAGAPARAWTPSFIGGMIAGALGKPKPLNAPKVFKPGPTPRNGLLEQFLARELAFVAKMDEAASLDWRALRVRSPALPTWAPRMNLGDGFRIHAVHVARHAGQIERVASKL
jgi:hypothetical protein